MDESVNERARIGATIVAAVWVVGFCVLFFTFRLPNNPAWTRGEFWAVVPFQLLELVDPSAVDDPAVVRTGYEYLPQRFALFGVAAFILLGCRAIGSRLLPVLRLDRFDDRLERETFAWGVGLSAWSLLVLGLGLAGALSQTVFVGILVVAIVADLWCACRSRSPQSAIRDPQSPSSLRWPALVAVAPFLVAIALGAALPSTDFDAKAYHLLGPKEFFLAGRVSFLPHNVYTSFPFQTEMLTLSGMVVWGDWFRGALVGKLVLAAFGPLTGLAIFAAARRWFGPAAGWIGVVVWLTTPWTYRISTIAYAEGGLSYYLFAATFATLLVVEARRAGRATFGPVLLVGLMAGSAMACKYPALLTVVVPLGGLVLVWPRSEAEEPSGGERHQGVGWDSGSHRVRGSILALSLGLGLTIGPWLLKNLVETGNPVYPLAYSVFGGRDQTPERAAKWAAGHSPREHDPWQLLDMAVDVSMRNDWLSPLLYGFAPLALLAWWPLRGYGRLQIRPTSWPSSLDPGPSTVRTLVTLLWLYVVYQFLVWWTFTHRIDRFWVPMLPVVALLAGVGATRFDGRCWRVLVGGIVLACAVYDLAFVTSGLSGNNAYRVDLGDPRAAHVPPSVAATNERTDERTRVLCVGDGELFDATFVPVYNTVFDESLFERWFADPRPGSPPADWALRPADEIRDRLKAERIDYVLVNWAELLRYRRPGSYGYSNFVSPRCLGELRARGVLGDPTDQGGPAWLDAGDVAEVEQWAPELLTTFPVDGEQLPALRTTWQLFPVEP